MSEGNRKDPRARVLNMTVRYKSATVDEFIENHSHDISRGGIFIKTRSPFPAGTLLKFEVRIAEDQKLMQGVGRVVWRREVDRAEESYPAGMGIKFIKTGEGAAELINQLVAARQGAESSFDAGAREAVTASAGGRPSSVPPPTPVAPKPSSPSPTSSPSLSVDSDPRGLAHEAETAVTSPAKKRQDQAPEKRKVVLQGPALEAPPSKPRPSPRPTADGLEGAAPPARPGRGSIAEETTARRTRPSAVKKPSDTPRWSGLIVILGLVGVVVFVVNRMRSPSAEEEAAPAPTVVAEPPPAVPSPPTAEAQPSDEAAAAVDPAAAPVQPASATEPPVTGSQEAAEPAPTPPSGAAPVSPAPASSGTSTAAAAAGQPAAATPPTAAPAPSPAPASPAAPSAAAPQKPPPPAPARPPAPKPAPAPEKPLPPKPSASVAPATPPTPRPAPAEPAPAPSTPPAATAGSGGDTASPTPPTKQPPTKQPPAASTPAPTPPAATPPGATPAQPPAPPPADDNPY